MQFLLRDTAVFFRYLNRQCFLPLFPASVSVFPFTVTLVSLFLLPDFPFPLCFFPVPAVPVSFSASRHIKNLLPIVLFFEMPRPLKNVL